MLKATEMFEAVKQERPAEEQDGSTLTLTFVRLELLDSGDRFNLKWSVAGADGKPRTSFAGYNVSKLMVRDAGARVRAALETFATAYVDQHHAQLIDLLTELRAAGEHLYEVLLNPDKPIPANKIPFRPWFEENVVAIREDAAKPDYALEVVMRPGEVDLIPPFGLVSTPRAGRPSTGSIDFDDYQDFWSISLRCACFTWVQLPNKWGRPIPGTHFDTVVVHERDDKSYALIQQRIRESGRRDESGSYSIEARELTAGRSLTASLSEAYKRKGVLFHFDLKATTPGSELGLALSEDRANKLQASDFHAIMKEAYRQSLGLPANSAITPYALAVIDREAIIRGDRGREWLEIFFSTPWLGLIAVEGDVRSSLNDWEDRSEIRPDRFLGLVFLRSILEKNGRRLIDSIVDARRDCWPFSLFYGLYCNPHQPWIDQQPALVEDINTMIPHLGRHHPAAQVGHSK
ncbi:MAG: hypothetical protein QOD94_2874 [Alphaproteobacteria bacterium]|jgi:hypothetical protein|nr:hypothetical protein [Alphaproteobacteria bacterium]